MMTKKHFIAIAEQVQRSTVQFVSLHNTGKLTIEETGRAIAGIAVVSRNMADYFASENPNFDRAHFLAACGVQS